ncbi:SRPBCC family protein [Chondromyces crocatus]|uniref:Polyketide cyclase n=1 Tax=Chondromyces crocatus TaxID=52 RepID=A0A0K1EE83_CHOCO|nr:SRPBCC family protein [Chondromyces crocatus]AKT39175.1 uncharacterized protein CMC5_033220 [Chondromyces crocatus]
MTVHHFRIESALRAAPDDVWRWATTAEGINHELGPLMRMTWPEDVPALDLSRVVLGERIGRSWLLLGGVLPVDRSDVTLVELGERRFVERSPMLAMKLWEHERSVTPAGDGCTVVDRLAFEPRFPVPASSWFVRRLFTHRHARLCARWGHRV